MTDLKCPFCPEVRPSRGRLQQHVDGMHYGVATSKERLTAVDNARTVEDVKIDPNRDILAEGLTRMNEKLSEAGGQMSEMKAALDAVDEKMRALDAQLVSPPVIRHATLNEVWDRLMAAGNITGAITVMDMIREGDSK